MMKCCSAHRCNRITCETCCWRYARLVIERIVTDWSGPFVAVTLSIPDLFPSGFRRLRMELRNRIDYLRRQEPLWNSFGLTLYLCADGKLRGIASLGLLGMVEVATALERWQAFLKPIRVGDLRVEVYRAVRQVSTAGPHHGRYWSRRLSISPKRPPVRSLHSPSDRHTHTHEPMPVVF